MLSTSFLITHVHQCELQSAVCGQDDELLLDPQKPSHLELLCILQTQQLQVFNKMFSDQIGFQSCPKYEHIDLMMTEHILISLPTSHDQNSYDGAAGGRLEADINSMPFSSILGLHLDRHEAEVAAIINAASKELTIELELKKLHEVWREQRLEVFKYTRGGTEERGLILRGECICMGLDR